MATKITSTERKAHIAVKKAMDAIADVALERGEEPTEALVIGYMSIIGTRMIDLWHGFSVGNVEDEED